MADWLTCGTQHPQHEHVEYIHMDDLTDALWHLDPEASYEAPVQVATPVREAPDHIQDIVAASIEARDTHVTYWS